MYTLDSVFTKIKTMKGIYASKWTRKNEMLDCVSGRGFAWELNPDFSSESQIHYHYVNKVSTRLSQHL